MVVHWAEAVRHMCVGMPWDVYEINLKQLIETIIQLGVVLRGNARHYVLGLQ